MSLRTGETVGAYRIVGLIGRGGAGQVFKVEHIITRRIEAIKVLSGRPDAREQSQRFLREIQIQASLSHPNIASVHNAFWAGEDLVMVMELVEGEPLKQIMERVRLPLETALDYAGQALAALEYAHAHHVTHRDITPGNMIVTGSGTVKLTDFGLAKLPADMRLTQTGAVQGSLYYMSPEQVRVEPHLDQRSDVYSMGAVLYEMVTGSKPFDGDSAFAIMSAHVSQDPRPPNVVNPALPAVLNDIILRAMAKDPALRFQSAAEFRAGLGSVHQAGVKRTAPPAALRWGIGAVAALAAGFLLIPHHRTAPVPPVPAPVPAVPHSATDAGQRRPKPEPVAPRTPRIAAGSAVWAVALSPSGKWLAAGTENHTIEIWNALTGEKHATLRGHSAGVTAVSFSRDEQFLVSGDANRTAKVWNLRAKSERNSLRVGGLVTAVAMSGDQGWLAIASSDRRVKLWNLKQDRQSGGFREKKEPSALAFSPDGSLIAVAAADGLKLRSVNNGREVQSFDRPGAGALAFTHDGNCLALSATQRGVRLWDAARSRELAAVTSAGSTRALALSQNGHLAAGAGNGGNISLWKMDRESK